MEKKLGEEDIYLDTSSEIEPFPGVEVIDYNDSITSTCTLDRSKYTMDELSKYDLKYVAGFIYYCYYTPEAHPKSSQYDDLNDMMQGEYADMIGFKVSDILNFVTQKLEENKNPKSILVKTLFDLVRNGVIELSDKTEEWLKKMFHILSQNEYGKLPIFPVMDLYSPQTMDYHSPVYNNNNIQFDDITNFSYV
jgi:hypothetical protein